ncbi:MAG: 30S ribosomal protein S3 [Candidatus Eremiobacteraeota bacterium]|nr:30S ribosomal protein S3 [Candidatus Eremiobacteraeota bacterium]MBV8204959.1 30S ribosomal protein S3 [Candidatus Eremiobacteraeota bacterium]
MGQKVNPVGFRLGITRTWDSRWFEGRQYRDWLHEDLRMRKLVDGLSRSAAVSKLEIERRANQVRVVVSTAKPGIIIGKRGAGIEELKKNLEKVSGRQVNINVVEIKHPELDAKLVANNIVDQLEKRIAFRRAMRQAIQRTMKAGAKGIKVQVGGRLGGAEIARVERNFEGKVPLHTLRANIDYAHSEAYTTFGRIGVKVWIYLGEVLPDGKAKADAAQPSRVSRPITRTRTRKPAEAAAQAPAGPESTAPAESATPGDATQAAAQVVQGAQPSAAPSTQTGDELSVPAQTASLAVEEPAALPAVEAPAGLPVVEEQTNGQQTDADQSSTKSESE